MLELCWNMDVAVTDETGFNGALDNFIAALDAARAALHPATEPADSDEPVQFA